MLLETSFFKDGNTLVSDAISTAKKTVIILAVMLAEHPFCKGKEVQIQVEALILWLRTMKQLKCQEDHDNGHDVGSASTP